MKLVRTLTEQELITILAALRFFQRNTQEGANRSAAEHFDTDDQPLTDNEIDDLCERLNCGR